MKKTLITPDNGISLSDLKTHRVVPRYQNALRTVGFCSSEFEPLHIGRGWVRVDVLLVPFSCAKKMNITFCFFSKRRESSINHRIHISRTINKKAPTNRPGLIPPPKQGDRGGLLEGFQIPILTHYPITWTIFTGIQVTMSHYQRLREHLVKLLQLFAQCPLLFRCSSVFRFTC